MEMDYFLAYINTLSAHDLVLVSFGILYVVEHVVCLIPGTYPYRYGILVTRLRIDICMPQKWEMLNETSKYTAIKVDDTRKEVYVRRKYSDLTYGPLLFVGQIEYSKLDYMNIRMGFLSPITLVGLAIYPFLVGSFSVNKLSIPGAIITVVVFYYFDFVRRIGSKT